MSAYKIDMLERTFFIAHGSALHFGCVGPDQVLHSGQPHLETFDDEVAWAARVVELGGDPYPAEDDAP